MIHTPAKYRIAGIIAALATSKYGIPMDSAIRKAAAPIMGGISCPPVEAEASTAPANSGRYPNRFIIGMVKLPEPTVLATELPDMVPSKALVNTATFAGPPAANPATALAKSIKNPPIPVFSRKAANNINRKINFVQTSMGVPIIPSSSKNIRLIIRSIE